MSDETSKGDIAVESDGGLKCKGESSCDDVGEGDMNTALISQLLDISERRSRVDDELTVDIALSRRIPGRDRDFPSETHQFTSTKLASLSSNRPRKT